MNPFLYPALIVLILCSISTVGSLAIPFGGMLIIPVWVTAGWMLAAIGLASLTGTGTRGAVITSAALFAWMVWRWRGQKWRGRAMMRV